MTSPTGKPAGFGSPNMEELWLVLFIIFFLAAIFELVYIFYLIIQKNNLKTQLEEKEKKEENKQK